MSTALRPLVSVAAVQSYVTWAALGAVSGAVAGLGIALLWLPFVVSARVRRLFELGPTGRWPVNYAGAFAALGALHVAVLAAGLGTAPSDDAVAAYVLFTGPLVALLAWAGASFALPHYGHDWLSDRALVARGLLFLGAVWYALLTTVPVFVAMVFYYYPG